MRRKIFEFVTLLLFINFLITPTLSLQNIQKISASGIIDYGRERMKWLHTNGKWIVDEDGNIVILRGANFMGYEFGAWNTHTEEDYARMASWGFNVVRLPIAWHYIEPKPGVYNESYFISYVDRDIAWAKKYGIYIILDMHQWRWSPHFGGNGLPLWMVAGYPDTEDGRNQAIIDFLVGKGPNGTDASLTNPSMQDRFIMMWKFVATRYADEPAIAGYDLFNELPRASLSAQEAASYLYSFYNKLIEEIRLIDSNHIIFYEPIGGYDTSTAQLLTKSNVAFSFHFYELRNNYTGNVEDLIKIWNWKYNYVKDWNIPVWIGEFGAFPEVTNALLWIRDIVNIFNQSQVGWAWWTYWKSDTYTISLCYTNGTERLELVQFLRSSKI